LLHESNQEVMLQHIKHILATIQTLGLEYKKTHMLALTHGQPAVPTTFGKELAIFHARIEKIYKKLGNYQFEGKLNGAVGNYNALHFVFPDTNWMKISNEFISSLGLISNNATNQILPADNMAAYFDHIKLLNSIFINLCQDMWLYISRELLGIKKEKDQVGSSTMPQKINPIAFENAEGNLYVANSLLELYSRKLSVSRMQRDLTDSTIKRTFGTALGHTLLAWTNVNKGLRQVQVNTENMLLELNEHMESVAEGLQVYLKHQGDQKGYETVQKLFQGKKISPEQFSDLMKELQLSVDISPESYIGIAERITERILSK
ncbi:MAG TPA: lyase family protein, partial [Candidatus Saccharimonadales bacterium]|nr:lyase family protein [Candidatus Saccharimonadales bacterium]